VNTMMTGDFNSIVGEGSTDKAVGTIGFGKINERGKMNLNFCKRHGLVVINTWFKKRKTMMYTWNSLGDQKRYQIDYILVEQE
jgi:hypothetical protein